MTKIPQTFQDSARRLHLFVSKGSRYHYVYGKWRLARWRENRFRSAETVEEIALTGKLVKEAADNFRDDAKLANHFRTRREPSYLSAETSNSDIASCVPASLKKETIERANEICRNRFSFRGGDAVTFDDRIDWFHQPRDNTDWRWDLNRHTFFETLGRAYWYTEDRRYVDKFVELLHNWLVNNPAHVSGPNWSSVFEVGIRINTWTNAFSLFRTVREFDDHSLLSLVKGIWQHADFLNRHIELHAENNHLLLEAKSLAVAGLLFPEFEQAAFWRRRGLRLFFSQLLQQVCEDGVHGERASLYHRIIRSELTELLVVLRRNQEKIPPSITDRLERMVEFELCATKPNNQIALLGDSSVDDLYLRYSIASALAFLERDDDRSMESMLLSESDHWLINTDSIERQIVERPSVEMVSDSNVSRSFPHGGYHIMRAGSGTDASYLLVDCGPFGYKRDKTHGHADALSFELHAKGQTWLLDPGYYSSHLGWNWRKYFRGTSAHNTITVKGQDQSHLLDSRRVYRPAQSTLHQWLSTEDFDFVDGSHNGYERLAPSITHRRQIFFVKDEYWILVDWLDGEGSVQAELGFHFPPELEVAFDKQRNLAEAQNKCGTRLHVVPRSDVALAASVVSGQIAPPQGWVSLRSGEKLAAPALLFQIDNALPLAIATILYPQQLEEQVSVDVESLVAKHEDGGFRKTDVALCIKHGARTDYFMSSTNPASSSHRDQENAQARQVGPFTTRSTLFYAQLKEGSKEPVKFIEHGENSS